MGNRRCAIELLHMWAMGRHAPLTPKQREMRAGVIKHIARARIRQLLRKMKGA